MTPRTWMIAAAGLLAGCVLLPERLAVNGPILQMLFGWGSQPVAAPERRIAVPEGFSIGTFAEGLPGARMLEVTPRGDLLVSLPRQGAIALVRADADGDGRSDGVSKLVGGLDRPHGIALRGEWLYVGEGAAVVRVRFDAESRRVVGEPEAVVSGLPAGGNHWTRTIGFGPDGGLYVSVGSSCNVCVERDPRRAAMLRFEADGSGAEIYATGLRNSVGFDWHPRTAALWATDNGRDLLGDDFPPCELNEVRRGHFYGWPHVNGFGVPDPDLPNAAAAEAATPPIHGFRAHNAPLGIRFVRGRALPDAYRDVAFVALHGSWNRREKDGYAVVTLHPRPDGSLEERLFATGFERDEDVIGRPVDVIEGLDGSIFVSDDFAGAIYRIRYGGPVTRRQGSLANRVPPAGALDDVRVARGRRLAADLGCAGCHDPERARPGVVPVVLRGLAARHDVASLEALLAAPPPPMPAFDLDAEARRDLAHHLLRDY